LAKTNIPWHNSCENPWRPWRKPTYLCKRWRKPTCHCTTTHPWRKPTYHGTTHARLSRQQQLHLCKRTHGENQLRLCKKCYKHLCVWAWSGQLHSICGHESAYEDLREPPFPQQATPATAPLHPMSIQHVSSNLARGRCKL
jgi:hypothetical protein